MAIREIQIDIKGSPFTEILEREIRNFHGPEYLYFPFDSSLRDEIMKYGPANKLKALAAIVDVML